MYTVFTGTYTVVQIYGHTVPYLWWREIRAPQPTKRPLGAHGKLRHSAGLSHTPLLLPTSPPPKPLRGHPPPNKLKESRQRGYTGSEGEVNRVQQGAAVGEREEGHVGTRLKQGGFGEVEGVVKEGQGGPQVWPVAGKLR